MPLKPVKTILPPLVYYISYNTQTYCAHIFTQTGHESTNKGININSNDSNNLTGSVINTFTVARLSEELTKRGIKKPSGARKGDLRKLLVDAVRSDI